MSVISDNVRSKIATSYADMDEENSVLYLLPSALRKFLEEASPTPYRPSQVRGYLIQHGEKATLSKLK